jgi:hypothetical protein
MLRIPPLSIMFSLLQTNDMLLADLGQTSGCRAERRGRRPAESQPEYELHVVCMHESFLSVLLPARFVHLPPERPRARIMHHRDWTCTTATTCHSGGTAQKTKQLRRNNSRLARPLPSTAGRIANENAAKHDFISLLGPQRSR